MKSLRTVSLLVLALLAAFFGGCKGGSSAAPHSRQEETTAAATEAATEVTAAAEPDAPVTEGRKELFTFTDSAKNTYTATYRLPALNYQTEDALAINREIEALYDDAFKTAAKEQSEQKPLSVGGIDFESNINGSVISLVIKSEDAVHTLSYSVFNYDRSEGRRLDNSGLLAFLQLDEDATYDRLTAALEEDYFGKFKYESFPDDYYYRLDQSAGASAIRESKLFLNENGELYALCTEYASVGKGTFQVLIRVPDAA